MIKSDYAVVIDLFGTPLKVAVQSGNKPRLYVEVLSGEPSPYKETIALDHRYFFDAVDLSLAVSDKVFFFSSKEKEVLQYILDNQTTFRTISN